MLTCRQTSEMATAWADGALDENARAAFDEHVRGCEGCATYVRQLEATRLALLRLPAPVPSPALNDALLASFDAWASSREGAPAAVDRRAWRVSPWAPAGAIGSLFLLLLFARQRSQAPEDWAIGAVLAVAALAVASVAGRFAMQVVLAAVAAAVAAAFAGGSPGPLDLATGVECVSLEVAFAAFVAGAAWLGMRGGDRPALRTAIAMGGLSGALSAAAALQLTCHAHGALPHLLAFHVGGVVLVAVAAAALLRSARVQSLS